MGDVLAGSFAKLERARERLDALWNEMSALDWGGGDAEDDPTDPSATLVVWRAEKASPPLHLGVMLGESLHNVRSALDQAVWEAVTSNGATPSGSNQFPIADTPEAWTNELKRGRLSGVNEAIQALVESTQPYHRGDETLAADHFLAVVREANNTDKHRTLPAQYMLSRTDRIRLPDIRSGSGQGAILAEWLIPDGPLLRLEDGTPLFRLRSASFTPHGPGLRDVQMSGPLPCYVAFEYKPGKVLSIGRMRECVSLTRQLLSRIGEALEP